MDLRDVRFLVALEPRVAPCSFNVLLPLKLHVQRSWTCCRFLMPARLHRRLWLTRGINSNHLPVADRQHLKSPPEPVERRTTATGPPPFRYHYATPAIKTKKMPFPDDN